MYEPQFLCFGFSIFRLLPVTNLYYTVEWKCRQSRAEPRPLSDRVTSLFLVLSLYFDLNLQTISAWTLQDEIVWTAHFINTKKTELQYLQSLYEHNAVLTLGVL